MAVCERTQTLWKGKDGFAFRGQLHGTAGLVIFVDEPRREALIVDIPTSCLPSVPDTSSGSEFEREGYWFYYPEGSQGYSILVDETHKSNRGVRRVTLGDKVIYDADAKAA